MGITVVEYVRETEEMGLVHFTFILTFLSRLRSFHSWLHLIIIGCFETIRNFQELDFARTATHTGFDLDKD